MYGKVNTVRYIKDGTVNTKRYGRHDLVLNGQYECAITRVGIQLSYIHSTK
jgi:hypothetical protein